MKYETLPGSADGHAEVNFCKDGLHDDVYQCGVCTPEQIRNDEKVLRDGNASDMRVSAPVLPERARYMSRHICDFAVISGIEHKKKTEEAQDRG